MTISQAVKAALGTGRLLFLLHSVWIGSAMADGGVILEISTEPAGAVVSVDGKTLGQTPVRSTGAVDPGFHRVLITLDGYKPFDRQMEITSVLRLNFRMEVDPHPPSPAPLPSASALPVPVPSAAASPAVRPPLQHKPPRRMRPATPPVAPLETTEPPRPVKPEQRNAALSLALGYSTATLATSPGSPTLRFLIGGERWWSQRFGLRGRLGLDPSASTAVPAGVQTAAANQPSASLNSSMGGYEFSVTALAKVYTGERSEFSLGALWLYWYQHYTYNLSTAPSDAKLSGVVILDESQIYRGSCWGGTLLYRWNSVSGSEDSRSNPYGYQAEWETKACSGALANGLTVGAFVRF